MIELKDFKVFSDLGPKDLSELESKIRRIKYGRGEIIFQEGAPAFGFYLVFEGHVKLVKRTLGGKKQILKLVGPGEIVGETTLFDKGVHIAYAKTLNKAVVGFIERGEFFDFLVRHPAVSFRFFEKLSEELKAFQCKLAERSYNGSKERLARIILKLGESGIELSRTELAEMAGVSSKTAIRTLGELQERGVITVDDRKITVLDPKSLEAMAEPFPFNLDDNLII
ncbi:MAG: Crp/Fnr family transcriptional regulator [Candidatus Bipolaricaulota bacterium]|nr:Crp/Fnr family transcriptional regulator [Candidatus Bipolaricaulota bacterium]MCS7274514.1 Crp/Fnr family transcriptional regulator [Candidatus Bipolaricaulota bacterium]MDW8111089.1 Crp/Fnr family transcriptional regulator [Candidatus Bipolaricaulota bacterium]MDW8329081.1 Crp/Fnr family transcriptional regulator [Candidatus Bipolaricaulota bacterium]